MKKRILVLVALLLAATLAGCECKHEWTEADCLNPQVCTKCEEVGAEALGHDFAPATCDSPKTCKRCGETQGEKLEHVMGSWQFEGEEMFKTCEACGAEERTAIDRELYVKEALIGFWDFSEMSLDGTSYDSNDLNYGYVGEFLNLYEDGTALYFDMADEIQLTWEYVEFEELNGSDVYTIRANSEDTGTFDMYIQVEEGFEDMLYYYMEGGDYVILSRQAPFAPALAGNWVSTNSADTYTLTLNPDHSFTLDLDPAISGTWHTKEPAYYGTSMEDAYATMTLMLRYPSADGHRVITSSVDLGEALQTTEEMLARIENDYLSFYLDELGSSMSFQMMSDEEIEALKQATAEAEQKILGTWTSKVWSKENRDTDETETLVTTDYTATFAEDGTVTLKLDEELTGTWTFDRVSVSGSYANYYYDLTIDGQEDTNWSIYLNGSNKLTVYKYEDEWSTDITFGQLSEEDKAQLLAGPQLPVGDWSCSERSWYDSDAQKMVSESGEYSATFREDGTFTLQLDETLNGTWTYYDYTPEEGNQYRLEFEGNDSGYIYNIYGDSTFSMFKDSGEIYYNYNMTKN